jgi:UPF0755 protein
MTQDNPNDQVPIDPAARRRGWFGRQKPSRDTGGKRRSERGRGSFVTAANLILTISLLAMLGLGAGAHYATRAFDAPGPLQADANIVIPRGSGLRDVADRLESAGAIGNPTLFMAGVQLTGNRGKMQAGEYAFAAQSSMRQIMGKIATGDVVEHVITIPEGLTSQQIVQRLQAEELLTGPVGEVPPEGSLLPETYQVVRGTTREQLLARMSAAQKKLLETVWEKRNRSVPVKTPHELVTLASIVEKETGVASERPHVASVFVNRLNKKMRIQSDPTIIYGLVGGKGTLGRPILKSEILKPTPYNTYTIPALPPGPIANPGRASMEAVANPLETGDFYFVADGTGGHAFAATYAEHRKNVARWRAVDQGQADRVPVGEEPIEAAPAGRRAER